MDVKEGDVLAGKYRVERVLGQGGMGIVVAAVHLQLRQRVALKFLLPQALKSPEMLARFAHEARAAARIRSEHVARVVDVGSLETGVPYIVMEYLEGGDLADYVAKRGPLPIEHAVELILEACEGLAEAHSLGVVHRDLKPANLFLARSPDGTACLKILDFGISKIISPDEPEFHMTQTGAIVGSPYYMAPEQMRSSRTIDARADVWSLGVILYELVSGRVPFDATTLPQLCGMVLSDPPPALDQWRADVPPRFQELVSHCLEKEPGMRFQSVADLALALAEFAPAGAARSIERILRISGSSLKPGHRASDRGPSLERTMATDWGRTSARGSRSRGLWGLVAGFALMAGLASWVFLRGPSRAPPGADRHADGDAVSAPPVSAGPAPLPAQDSEGRAPALADPIPTLVPLPSVSTMAPPTPRHAATGPKHAPVPAASAPTPAPALTPKSSPSPLDGRF